MGTVPTRHSVCDELIKRNNPTSSLVRPHIVCLHKSCSNVEVIYSVEGSPWTA